MHLDKQFSVLLGSDYSHSLMSDASTISVMPFQMPLRDGRGHQNKIKLVYGGTEEYKQAKQKQAMHAKLHRDLHKDFSKVMEAEIRSIREYLRMTAR